CSDHRGLITPIQGACGNILRGIDVPTYAFKGDEAVLKCQYDLRATRLYSLKWYHNNTEFYRYVPTERTKPINIKPGSTQFLVHEISRTDTQVTLIVKKLTASASGQYRCEVIAEHPSFRTDSANATMTVLLEPLPYPVVVGLQELYEPSEIIKVGCQPTREFSGHQQPEARWFVHGARVEPEWVSEYTESSNPNIKGISLHIAAKQIMKTGGSLEIECRLTLGAHFRSSFKVLRVRMREPSAYATLSSSGKRDEAWWALHTVFLLNCLHR
ncbi:unnamed protein product, partial [Meganyctiphanes norvegica]